VFLARGFGALHKCGGDNTVASGAFLAKRRGVLSVCRRANAVASEVFGHAGTMVCRGLP